MRNNVFLSLLLGVLSMFAVPNNNRAHKIDPKDKAILRILHYRQMYMPSGVEKIKNDSFLTAITDELNGTMIDRINHLKIHGLRANSAREAAMRLAERYILTN